MIFSKSVLLISTNILDFVKNIDIAKNFDFPQFFFLKKYTKFSIIFLAHKILPNQKN